MSEKMNPDLNTISSRGFYFLELVQKKKLRLIMISAKKDKIKIMK